MTKKSTPAKSTPVKKGAAPSKDTAKKIAPKKSYEEDEDEDDMDMDDMDVDYDKDLGFDDDDDDDDDY